MCSAIRYNTDLSAEQIRGRLEDKLKHLTVRLSSFPIDVRLTPSERTLVNSIATEIASTRRRLEFLTENESQSGKE